MTASIHRAPRVPKPVSPVRILQYRCPACEAPMPRTVSLPLDWRIGDGLPPAEWEKLFACPTCQAAFASIDGVPCLMVDGDLREAEPFLRHYEAVRDGEGAGLPLEVIRDLPELPPNIYAHDLAALWRRRRDAYQRLIELVRRQTSVAGASLTILDLGAGNGWLAWRLHGLGHQVVATDLCLSPHHGLGMARRIAVGPEASGNRPAFLCVQATMENLPFVDRQFDLVIAAASLHYARSITRAVREAARVLVPGGALILIDTPLYETAAAGEVVVRRRLADQCSRFGTDGTDTAGPYFLVRAELRRTFQMVGLRYQEIGVHDTLRSTTGGIRRWARRALHRRELATMPLVLGGKERGPC